MTFEEKLISYQSDLASHLDSEQLPERIMEMLRDLMEAENCLVVGVDGTLVGNWWVRNSGWKVKTHSMNVVETAVLSEKGYWKGGIEDSNPTQSQISENILSCIAARMNSGNRTIGAVYCDIRNGNKRFTEEDGKKLKLLADCFSVHFNYFEQYQKLKQQQADKAPPESRKHLDSFVAENKVLKDLKTDLETTARLSTPVLILGESGVGKEVVAQMLHELSDYSRGEFVVVHCAAISKDLFESELFGHERGAFSGAFRKRQGLVLRADGGSLFLDEVGDIPPEAQVKLLRLLEAKMVRPVGSDIEVGPVNFRLISATNRNLERMVAEKTFREDLFYRIRGRLLRIPPLRERAEDIPLLSAHFASPKKLTPEALDVLQSTPWPGNVRQLKAVVDNARNATQGYEIPKESILKELQFQQSTIPAPEASGNDFTFFELKMHWQKGDLDAAQLQKTINRRYEDAGGNWNEVARQWGLFNPEQVKAFRNWIYYLQKTRIIRPPEPKL